ncbi:MAG: hypothetical protein WCS42_05670 [Verrucomicrobiota bacterium]
MNGEIEQQTPGVRVNPGALLNGETMENLPYIISLIILAVVVLGLIWNVWPWVIGILAMIGLAQVYWVWRNRYGREG